MLGRFELSSRKGDSLISPDMDHDGGEVLIPDPLARIVQRRLRSAALDVTIQDDNCRDAFYVEHGARSHRAVVLQECVDFQCIWVSRRDCVAATMKELRLVRVTESLKPLLDECSSHLDTNLWRGSCTTTESASSIVLTRHLSGRLSGCG